MTAMASNTFKKRLRNSAGMTSTRSMARFTMLFSPHNSVHNPDTAPLSSSTPAKRKSRVPRPVQRVVVVVVVVVVGRGV
jgi:hypothetical protein